MLLGAASLNIKTVVKNLDDFLLKPLGQAYYQWNMQFFEGELGTEGDLEIHAIDKHRGMRVRRGVTTITIVHGRNRRHDDNGNGEHRHRGRC